MYMSKLSSQHRTYEPFSVTSGFRSVCLFLDPGKCWVSNFDAFIDFSYMTTYDNIMGEFYYISVDTTDARAC